MDTIRPGDGTDESVDSLEANRFFDTPHELSDADVCGSLEVLKSFLRELKEAEFGDPEFGIDGQAEPGIDEILREASVNLDGYPESIYDGDLEDPVADRISPSAIIHCLQPAELASIAGRLQNLSRYVVWADGVLREYMHNVRADDGHYESMARLAERGREVCAVLYELTEYVVAGIRLDPNVVRRYQGEFLSYVNRLSMLKVARGQV